MSIVGHGPSRHVHPAAAGGRAVAWDERRMRAFRHRAAVFELLDHEASATVAAILGLGGIVLVALTAMGGGVARADGDGPGVLAWVAAVSLGVALLVGVCDALAGLLARPVGRDAGRTVTAIEGARYAVARLRPVAMCDDADAELRVACHRVERAITHVLARLAAADSMLIGIAGLPDARTRSGRLAMLREEAGAIGRAADAVDEAAHLLRWIEACPWSPARPDAMRLLQGDLGDAERLAAEGARD